MRAFLVLLALLPCVAAAQSLDEGVTGGRSVVASRYQWGSTGGDWAVPPEAPAPIVACDGDFRSGACGATTFTASGTPGLASTYWRPGGGDVGGAGVAFDGTDDYLDAGDVGDQAGDFTICVPFVATSSTAAYIVAKDANPTGRSFTLYKGGTNAIVAYVHAGDSSTSSLSLGTATLGVESIACFAYDFVASGTSVLRGTLNGVAPAELTTAVGPPQNTASPLRIGAFSGATPGGFFSGTISRPTIWSGWAATAADLARMVNGQYAKQGSLGEPVAWTRDSIKSCQIGAAWFTVPKNMPCIGSAGANPEGARINSALNSGNLSVWSKTLTPIVTQTWSAAFGTDGSTIEDDDAAVREAVFALYSTSTTGTYTFSCHMRAGTLSQAQLQIGSNGTGGTTCNITGLSATTSRATCTATIDGTPTYVAGYVYPGDTVAGTVGTVLAGACQLEAGATASSYIATGATPAARAADAPSAGHGIADPNRWTIKVVADPDSTAAGVAWSIGAFGAANSVRMSVGTNLVAYVYDSTGASKNSTATAGFVAGARNEVTLANDGGELSWLVNGVASAPAEGGSWSGVPTALGLLYVGTTSTGVLPFNGAIPSITTCNTSEPTECQ